MAKDGDLILEEDPKKIDPNDIGPTNQPPYIMKKAWNLGITLAAMQLGLDLDNAIVEPRRIILTGTNGVKRIIPTDDTHSFYIDWKLRWKDINNKRTAVLAGSPLQILAYDFERQQNATNYWKNIFTNKLVIFGSVARATI